MLGWLLPLLVTVSFYGLAGGIWKQCGLTLGAMSLLYVAAKSVVNLGAWLAFSRQPFFDRESRGFLKWAMAGSFFNGLAWIGYFTALTLGPAAIVQTITAAYTALAALLALIFLRERVVAVQAVGIALVIGAGLFLGYTGATEGGAGWVWVAASVATLLFWGVAVTMFKQAYNQPHADDWRFFVVNWVGIVLTMLPYGLATEHPLTPGRDLTLGLVIVTLYALGDLTLFAAIARGPASIVSPVSGLYPVPTLFYASLVLGEKISPAQWVAIVVVLAAIVMVVPAPDNPLLRLLQGSKRPAGNAPAESIQENV